MGEYYCRHMSPSRVVTSPDSVPDPAGEAVGGGAGDPVPADPVEDLARSVARLRRASELTLATVAAEAGLSPAYVSQIESGAANPTMRTLAQIAKGLGRTVAELFGSEPAQGAGPAFPAGFSRLPLLAGVDGQHGVWDLTADGATALRIRLVMGRAADHGEPVRHDGEELVAVLRGHCRVRVGATARVLRPGDTCHLTARDEHRISEPSDDLLALVVLTAE